MRNGDLSRVWVYGEDVVAEIRTVASRPGVRDNAAAVAALMAFADHFDRVWRVIATIDGGSWPGIYNSKTGYYDRHQQDCACEGCVACREHSSPENIVATIKALLPPEIPLEATRLTLTAEIEKAQAILDTFGRSP